MLVLKLKMNEFMVYGWNTIQNQKALLTMQMVNPLSYATAQHIHMMEKKVF
jgi:hypothetical protein